MKVTISTKGQKNSWSSYQNQEAPIIRDKSKILHLMDQDVWSHFYKARKASYTKVILITVRGMEWVLNRVIGEFYIRDSLLMM